MPRAALLLLAAAGCLHPVPIEGSGCPCPSDYVCCGGTSQCMPPGAICPGTSPPPPPPPPPPPRSVGDTPGPAPLRRLNLLEYRNSVRDLLGDDSATIGDDFVADDTNDLVGFGTGATIGTGRDLLPFVRAAERLARTAVGNLAAFLPASCEPATSAGQDACADAFITSFGLRAFRRPVTAEEAAGLRALYQKASALPLAFPDTIRVLITAFLESPFFLYRWEGGLTPVREGGLVRLDSYEIASRLSYALWASMPDAALFDAAAADQLTDPDKIAAQARRLLADPRSKDMVADFHQQWIGAATRLPYLTKDPSFHFSPQLAQAMLGETGAFAASVFHGPQATGRLYALLTSTATFVNEDLAVIYGLGGVRGPELRLTALDPTQRSGIFTQPAFLATWADDKLGHPILRGQQILSRVVCVDIREPSGVISPPLPEKRDDQTTRQWSDGAVETPCAVACHSLLSVGDAFEQYDGIGAYRTIEAGQQVDASGSLMLHDPVSYRDATDLSRRLVDRTETHECLARQWLRYMLRRREGDGDQPSLDAAGTAFVGSQLDLRELIVALTRTRAFTHRSPSSGEGMP